MVPVSFAINNNIALEGDRIRTFTIKNSSVSIGEPNITVVTIRDDDGELRQ